MDQGNRLLARDFAVQAHGDQKYGNDKPYVVHLDDVAGLLRRFGYDDQDLQDGAFLHDVLEDTKVTFEELEKAFGGRVALIALFCTDLPGYPNRRTRKAATYAKMRAVIDQARTEEAPEWLWAAVGVKLADQLANIQSCFTGDRPDLWQMYYKERQAFSDALYTEGLYHDLWDEYERLLSVPPAGLGKALRDREKMAGFAKTYGGSEVSTLTPADAVTREDLKRG